MVFSSLALSVWSLLFPPFFLLYWLYCDDHGWMSCITECRPSDRMLSCRSSVLVEEEILKNLPFPADRIYCLIDTMIWNKRISSNYFSSCIFPVFDRIWSPGFHLFEFFGSLSFFKIGRLTSDPIGLLSNKSVDDEKKYSALMKMHRYLRVLERRYLWACRVTTYLVLQWSYLSFLSLFFFVSLLYRIRCNLSTTFLSKFKLSVFSDILY